MVKILLIAGSNRKEASSTKLLRYLADRLKARGVDAELFDLYASPLPMYAPDDEEENERHPNVQKLFADTRAADGFIIATPEYHGSLTGTLKNALDYLGKDEVGGKPVLSVSSAGGAVGVNSLTQLQGIVRYIHGINSPEWVSIGGGQRIFNADGLPADEGVRVRAERALDRLVSLAEALKAGANP